MRGMAMIAGGLLALILGGCSLSPYVRDPGCKAAYETCVAGCPMGPPESPFGHEATPSFEQTCLNGCYTNARACESRARDREQEPPQEGGEPAGAE